MELHAEKAEWLTRRDFITGGIALGTVATTVGLLAGCSPSAEASEVEWDEEKDVVVVGFGGAGAAAALMASAAGAEVLILERGETAGGCTALCGQAILGVDTPMQQELGFKDSSDQFFEYLKLASDGDEGLLEVLAYGVHDAFMWLMDLGMTVPAELNAVPGVTWGGREDEYAEIMTPIARTHWTSSGVWAVLQKAVQDAGIEDRTSTPVIGLVTRGEDNEVVGVIAGTQESPTYIKARKGVVLSAGGFASNPDMVRAHITTGKTVSFSGKNDIGEGIRLGQSVGAGVAFLNSGNDAPAYAEPIGACQFLIPSAPVPNEPPFIAVSNKGQRFCSETQFHIPTNRAIMALPGGMCYIISGGPDGLAGISLSCEPASLKTSETIEGLAGEIGIDAVALKATVDKWNADCAVGADTAFGRARILKPLDTAPFFAAEVYPGFSSTLSGLTVDTSMNVLEALWQTPIPRLFAAGANSDAQGRIYQTCGLGVGNAVVTGRIAGTSVAALEVWA